VNCLGAAAEVGKLNVRRTRFLVSITGVLLTLVIGATPVAAYNHLGTTGTTGTHSLTDTRSTPGADCLYRFKDSGSAWELRRITVDPPNVQANAFQDGDQEVGWRFTVDRRYSDAFQSSRVRGCAATPAQSKRQ
jgi:hypothetical protein